MKIINTRFLIALIGVLFLFVVPNKVSSQNEDEFEVFESFEDASEEDFSEFEAFDENEEITTNCNSNCNGGCEKDGGSNKTLDTSNPEFWWVIGILLTTVLAGIFVRFKQTRGLRGLFLLVSLLILGFYRGGCPCPIMSLQHTLFAIMGIKVNVLGMIWFVGLLVVTYFFGKVWCGWICHLGAMQEFIFIPGKFNFLKTERAQKVMRTIRILFLVALIIQILITKNNFFKTIDPFKVAFNFRASSYLGWILLGLTLLSSVFIYRPFCKTVCPIGLVLGWITKIPGAAVIAPNSTCISCKTCNNSCKINAITRDGSFSLIDNQECIACGDCASDCKKSAVKFTRNTSKTPSKNEFKV